MQFIGYLEYEDLHAANSWETLHYELKAEIE